MEILSGCQGRDRTPTVEDKKCPNCGAPMEIFSIETEAVCEKCGTVIYNDALSCVQWCKYARRCVGDEAFEALMKVARAQKERKNKEEAIA